MEGKADLHTHTKHSGLTQVSILRFPDSISEPAALVKAAEREKLNVLCVTDHNTIKGGLEAKKFPSSVEVVVGEEVNTLNGDMIALFLNETIPRHLSPEETIDRIHAQGGLAIAAHPFSADCDSLGFKVLELKLDGIEVFNAAQRDGLSNATAQKLTMGKVDVAFVGASDAHTPAMVGNAYTIFEGQTAEDLRKAIIQKKTRFGGSVTPLGEFVWLATITSANMYAILARSLFKLPVKEENEAAAAVSTMRPISKFVSLVGAGTFVLPPFPLLAAIAGDRIHRSKARVTVADFLKQAKL